MKICFVILHYMTIEDTERCIKSIIDTVNYKNYKIVVVDNGSTNTSGLALENKYQLNENVETIILTENLGFAKGNNIGYNYARNCVKADIIIILNSDTVIIDDEFVYKIIKSYQKNSFYVLGPDIITPKFEHQNPFRNRILNIKEVKRKVLNKTIFLFYYKLKSLLKIKTRINILENLFETKSLKGRSLINYKEYRENVVLQGACLVFSYDYIKNEENAFLPDTFMYGEEDLLAYFCANKQYKMVYDPEIKILHMDGASTKGTCNNTLEKNLFFTKYTLEGSKILLRKMKRKTSIDSED